MNQNNDQPFFVGYLPTPVGLKVFLVAVAAGLIGMFGALALAIGSGQDDPGSGSFQWGWGPQTVTGVMQINPYPVLHVTKGSKRLPAGKSLLLSGPGKNGVQKRVAKLDGRRVTLRGIALKRGDITALQVGGGAKNIKNEGAASEPVKVTRLGRWRLKGEICDGKCLAGAMRPGRGLSHRACANLCLIGGAPPVFVSAAPVDGEEFFLLADQDGKPLPEEYLKHVAVYIELDGEVERRGSILVFKVTLDSLKVL
ncbi:MAG: hypothetical protein ACR2OV_08160 [Hyphomicrobiaceae bacterium]